MPKLTSGGLVLMNENPRLSKPRKPKEQTLPITENTEEPAADKKTKEHVVVKVKYLKLLSDRVGSCAEAARLLGVAPSLVSGAILKGEARQVNELAAQFILDKLGAHIFGAMTVDEIIESLRRDLEEASKYGLGSFRFDEAGVLRATVNREL